MTIPKDNKIIEDISKMASSTMATIVNIKDDLASYIKQQIKSILKDMDFVTKQDYLALKKSVAALEAEVRKLTNSAANKKPASGTKPSKVGHKTPGKSSQAITKKNEKTIHNS